MKLPFDFANKFLLRLLLPGALLAAIFWPLILGLCTWLGIQADEKALVPVAILFFGWMMLLFDMPIYMLLEGRRFWPGRLLKWGVTAEQKRLDDLITARDKLALGTPQRTELSLEIRKFPLDQGGKPHARFPTRLGNLIAASETYPDRKYGIDGVFGWYRLWVVIDKDLRGELDDQQAIVDSALYACMATAIAVPLCLFYAMLAWLKPASLLVPPSAVALLLLAGSSVVAARMLYHGVLMAQAQYGEFFAALFDQHIDKLEFKPIVDQLAATMAYPNLAAEPQRTKARAAVRFLKWHRYRQPGATTNATVQDW